MSRNANGKTLHALRQTLLVIGLDEQMNVVRLDAEVNDPKKALSTCANLSEHATKYRLRTKAGQTGAYAHGDVQRMRAEVRAAREVRHAGTRTLGLSPSATSCASPRVAEVELELSETRHVQLYLS